MPRLTPEQRDEVARRYVAGDSMSVLSAEFFVSAKLISTVLKECGVKSRRLSCAKRLTPEQRNEVVRRYVAGESSIKIGQELNIDSNTVRKWVCASGVGMRSMNEAKTKYTVNHNAFSNLSSEEVKYWIGFLFADGCVYQKTSNPVLSLSLSSIDQDHVKKFKSFLNSSHPIKYFDSKGSYSSVPKCQFAVVSKTLCYDLIRYGRYSGSLNFNLWSSRHFWRGVIDGDGCLVVSPQKHRSIPIRVELVGEFWIVDSFKRRWAISGHKSKSSVRPHKSIFRYQTSGVHAVDCIRWLYGDATVYLDRKYAKAQEILAEFG